MEQIKTVLKVIKAAARVSKVYFITGCVALILTSSLPILANYFLAGIIQSVSQIATHSVTIESVYSLLMFYILVLLLSDGADEIFNSIAALLIRYDLGRYFSGVVFAKVNELDLEFFENPKYADLKSRALDTYEWRPADLMRFTFYTLEKLLAAMIAGITIFLIIPKLAILIMLAIIPSMLVDYYFQAGAWDIWTSDTRTRRSYGYLLNISNDSENRFTKELRLLGLGDYFRNLLDSLIGRVYTKQKKVQYKRMYGKVFINLVPLAAILFTLFVITKQLFDGTLTLGLYTFIISSVFMFKNKFTFAMFDFGNLLSEAKYVVDVFKFLELKPRMKNAINPVTKIKSPPGIEFKNVDFKYPGTKHKILDNFDLKINPGEKIAIVGENGAGKSTIIKLLLRFYDVTQGELLINGINIKKIDIATWRKQIAALLQDFRTFKMLSIADNIGFGNLVDYIDKSKLQNSKKPLQQIIQSSIDAKSHEFITKDKAGYDAIVGRDFEGVDFSGGELQRLALARTFYRDAGLIIMDEPTSAVDAKAEMEIFASITEHLKDKTVIFVSHRFSTVRVADRIIVMENGKIQEDGSHQELLKKGGTYALMFNAQAQGYK